MCECVPLVNFELVDYGWRRSRQRMDVVMPIKSFVIISLASVLVTSIFDRSPPELVHILCLCLFLNFEILSKSDRVRSGWEWEWKEEMERE